MANREERNQKLQSKHMILEASNGDIRSKMKKVNGYCDWCDECGKRAKNHKTLKR